MSGPGPASVHTRAAHAESSKELPFEDREDFEDARRGLIESAPSLVLRDARGRTVWDMDSYAFVDEREGADTWRESVEANAEGEPAEGPSHAPDTVHPSLWRMAQLNGIHGLFEVVPGIYQVRGYDLSNMTLVEGTRGVIVIDPLVSTECAAAALALYRKHRGEREVSAVVYTHSHVDHFGGVKGVVSAEQVQAGEVPVWAPAGFLEHAVSENVLAGGAMARRAQYMFAPGLKRGPRGQVDAGIGKTTSTGSITLIPPTNEVTHTGQETEIDGVPIVFQLVPDSEAPAEMNFFFKDLGVLCVAENAVHCMHNVLTPRGAPVRDSLAWSKYLGEAIELFGARTDVMFAQHHWPRWGKDRIVEHLARHRDMYRYLHDQTLRLANRGLTPAEIAAEVRLPPSLGARGRAAATTAPSATTCAPSTSATWASSTVTRRIWIRIRRLRRLGAMWNWPVASTGCLLGPTLPSRRATTVGRPSCARMPCSPSREMRGKRAAGICARAARLPVRERGMAQPVSRRRARAARGTAAFAEG